MTILFISDLHLSPANPENTERFIHFLQQHRTADALYILGDLFDVYLGDDIQDEFIEKIIQALKDTSQSLPIYIMHGNRDFLIGQYFIQKCGAHLIDDPTLINLYGVATLLTHGDSLCILDKRYQLYRKIVHHRFTKRLFLLLPLNLRQSIAKRLRKRSKQHQAVAKLSYLDTDFTAIQQVMHNHQATQLIHGHTHQPSLHYFAINTQPQLKIVLSDWHKQAHVLYYRSDGTKRLMHV